MNQTPAFCYFLSFLILLGSSISAAHKTQHLPIEDHQSLSFTTSENLNHSTEVHNETDEHSERLLVEVCETCLLLLSFKNCTLSASSTKGNQHLCTKNSFHADRQHTLFLGFYRTRAPPYSV